MRECGLHTKKTDAPGSFVRTGPARFPKLRLDRRGDRYGWGALCFRLCFWGFELWYCNTPFIFTRLAITWKLFLLFTFLMDKNDFSYPVSASYVAIIDRTGIALGVSLFNRDLEFLQINSHNYRVSYGSTTYICFSLKSLHFSLAPKKSVSWAAIFGVGGMVCLFVEKRIICCIKNI